MDAGNHLPQSCGSQWQMQLPPSPSVLRLGVGQAGLCVLGAEHPERQSSGPSWSEGWQCYRDREEVQRGQDGWVLLAVCGYAAEQPFQSLPATDVAGRPLLKCWVQCVLQNHLFNWKFNLFFPKYFYCLSEMVSKISFPR